MALIFTQSGRVTRFASGLLVGRLTRDEAGRWPTRVLALRHATDKRRTRAHAVSFVNTLPTLPCDSDYREIWYTLGALRPLED